MIQNNFRIEQLTYRSNAHTCSGKITGVYSNGLQFQLQDTSISPVLTPSVRQIKQCRICLDNEQNDQNKLFSPCLCTGSVQYVHDKCYREWIEKQFQSKDQQQKKAMIIRGVQCELCKKQIYLNFQRLYKCMEYEKFIEMYNQNRLIFFSVICLLTINFGCLAFLSYFCIANKINFNSFQSTLIIIICAFVILVITAIVIAYNLIDNYLMQKKWILRSFSRNPPQVIIDMNIIYPEQSNQQIQ